LVEFWVNVTVFTDGHFMHMTEVTQKTEWGDSCIKVNLASVSLTVLPHELLV